MSANRPLPAVRPLLAVACIALVLAASVVPPAAAADQKDSTQQQPVAPRGLPDGPRPDPLGKGPGNDHKGFPDGKDAALAADLKGVPFPKGPADLPCAELKGLPAAADGPLASSDSSFAASRPCGSVGACQGLVTVQGVNPSTIVATDGSGSCPLPPGCAPLPNGPVSSCPTPEACLAPPTALADTCFAQDCAQRGEPAGSCGGDLPTLTCHVCDGIGTGNLPETQVPDPDGLDVRLPPQDTTGPVLKPVHHADPESVAAIAAGAPASAERAAGDADSLADATARLAERALSDGVSVGSIGSAVADAAEQAAPQAPGEGDPSQALSPSAGAMASSSPGCSAPSTVQANRQNPVLFVHGIDPLPGNAIANVNAAGEDTGFGTMMYKFACWGWDASKLYGVAFYECDHNFSFIGTHPFSLDHHGKPGAPSIHEVHLKHDDGPADDHDGHEGDCTTDNAGPHTQSTSIEHLGYHWAWTIYDHFTSAGQCVEVVGYSMGGLITRYAVYRTQAGDPDFPPSLCVQDVVTLGTPHGGRHNDWLSANDQADQMESGTDLLDDLGTNAPNPQGTGGTDWTAMASTDDATTGRYAIENFAPDETLTYDNVDHYGTDGWLDWNEDTIDEDVTDYTNKPIPGVYDMEAIARVSRYTDMALAYDDWGCGTPTSLGAWQIGVGNRHTGEPYDSTWDCWYDLVLPSGMPQLVVQEDTLSGADRDIYVRHGSVTATPSCSGTSTAAFESCTVASPAAGQWFIQVRNYAGVRDPFTVVAYTSVPNDLTGVHVYSAPSSVPAGSAYSVCWHVAGSGSITHTQVHWGTVSGSYPNVSPVQTGSAPANFCATLTAPSSGTIRLVAHAMGPADNLYSSPPTAIAVIPNDCGTTGDAGNTHAAATYLSLPVTGCSGWLAAPDTNDYYRFYVAAGQSISATMTPNPSADFDLCLYNPSGSAVACSYSGTGATESVSYAATASGEWRMRAFVHAGSGAYTFSVSASSPPNDCGTGGDAGNSHAAASLLYLPVSGCTGALPSGDTQDWYRFGVTAGQAISVTLSPNPSADFDLCLYNPSGSSVACSGAGTGATDSISYTATVTGQWRAVAYVYSGSGSYSFWASLSGGGGGGGGGSGSDCYTGADAGNSHAAASAVTPPVTSCPGSLSSSDTQDWYRFSASSGQTITASVTPGSGTDFDLCLYNPSGGSAVLCSTYGGSATDTASVTASVAGSWRAQVYVYSGYGPYTFSVSVTGGGGGGGSPGDCYTGSDAGNAFASATLLYPTVSGCPGSLSASDTQDWYRFGASSGQTISVSMTPNSGADFDLCLADPAGTVVACSVAGTGATDSLSHSAGSTGQWRARVYIHSGTGPYSFSVSVTAGGGGGGGSANDCGTGGDAGNSFGAASGISTPVSCSGTLPSGDTMDWYQFYVTSGQSITATMTPSSGADFDACLNAPSAATVACSSVGGSATESITYTATATGWWRVDFYPSSGSGPYTMAVSLGAAANDCGTGGDAGNSFSAASTITPPVTSCGAALPSGDPADWYRFGVTAGQAISVSMTPNSGADFDLCLADPAGTAVACSYAGTGATDSVSYTAGSTGQWRVQVYPYAGTGPYTLSVSVTAGGGGGGSPANDCGTGGDAGNSFSAASTITPPVTSCGAALPSGDPMDWYQFYVTSGQTITASMTDGSGADFDVCLNAPSAATVACSGSAAATENVVYTATATGWWRFDVYPYSGTGGYTMSVSLSSGGGGGGSPASDCGTGGDAGNSFGAASGITLPVSSCSGALPGGDAQDWYQFSVASGASLTVSMTPNSGADFDLCVYDPGGSSSWCSFAGTGATDSVSLTASAGGSWRAVVYVYSGSGGYTFSASASSGSSGDCGMAGDAGNSFGSATTIPTPRSCTGTLGAGGDTQDWYAFYKPSGASLSVSVTPNPSADFDLCLYDPGGTAVACSYAGTGATDSISGTTGASGYWRAVVYVYGGSGGYSYSVS